MKPNPAQTLASILLLTLPAHAQVSEPDSLRLNPMIAPFTQALKLELDPANHGYSGVARVELQFRIATNKFRFHSQDINLGKAMLDAQELTLTPEKGGIISALAAEPVPIGLHTFEVAFTNDFNRDGTGLYKAVSGGRPYLFTKFEPVDARRAFPCWDEPGFKIPWLLSVSVPMDMEVVGNMPIAQTTPAGTQKLVEFGRTPPMPSYLVALVLDTEADIKDAEEPVSIPRIEGRVEFKNVTFGYEPHKPVIKEVSFSVAPGEMIGLVGQSGAGKSTTINLICRFYEVVEGEILIDGVNIRQIAQKDLRSQIGVVLQEPFLFSGSIFENIAFARPGAASEDVMAAAKTANAHDFIIQMPDGYDTQVGERGQTLSGGERQRVSIARAILCNPRILILDEATASVDTDTEKQIQDAIARLIQGRTTFAIAHRLSTLRNATRLVVLKDGKVAEVGTHEELIAKKGEFHRLVQMQQEMNKIIEIPA